MNHISKKCSESYWKSVKLAVAVAIIRLKPQYLSGEQYATYLQIQLLQKKSKKQEAEHNTCSSGKKTGVVLPNCSDEFKCLNNIDVDTFFIRRCNSSVKTFWHKGNIKPLQKYIMDCTSVRAPTGCLLNFEVNKGKDLSNHMLKKTANIIDELFKLLSESNDDFCMKYRNIILETAKCIIDAAVFHQNQPLKPLNDHHDMTLTELYEKCLNFSNYLIIDLSYSVSLKRKSLYCDLYYYFAQCKMLSAKMIKQLLVWITNVSKDVYNAVKFNSCENLIDAVALPLINSGIAFSLLEAVVLSLRNNSKQPNFINMESQVTSEEFISAAGHEKKQRVSTRKLNPRKSRDDCSLTAMMESLSQPEFDKELQLLQRNAHHSILALAYEFPILAAYSFKLGLNVIE